MTYDSTPADQRHRIETELVEVLASMQLMQQLDSRQQLVQVLRRRLNHLATVRDFPDPRQQGVEIASACLPVPAGLAVVHEVIELFAPAAGQLTSLARLRHEADVIDVLADEDWLELRPRLETIIPRNPSRLYQRATGRQLSYPPVWCASAWDMFVHLSGQNAAPGGLTPGMIFLLLLEQEVDSSVASLIRRRNQRRATEHGLTEELDHRRVAMNAGTDQPEPFIYLVIQVEPDLGPEDPEEEPPDRDECLVDQYTVSHFRQWHDGDSWRSQMFGQERQVPQDELEAAVENAVRAMEVGWSDRRAEVIVELVLPLQLINEDVPWWCKEKAAPFLEKKVLAMDYPVVVRSLERLRHRDWHRAWRLRWDMLRAEPAGSQLYRSLPRGDDYFTRLEAELNSDLRWTTLLLSRPPSLDTPTGIQEIMTALRSGLPVVIWHRTRDMDTSLWEEIRELTADGRIARLPVYARQSRLAALRTEPTLREEHIGRHLAVLWDDPERAPELDGAALAEGGASQK